MNLRILHGSKVEIHVTHITKNQTKNTMYIHLKNKTLAVEQFKSKTVY